MGAASATPQPPGGATGATNSHGSVSKGPMSHDPTDVSFAAPGASPPTSAEAAVPSTAAPTEAAAPPRPKVKLFGEAQAGLTVFLVALPLCLGIATASGASPLSGLIAGLVGGTVVALASGSSLSVAGPAAGLTVIVLDAIQRLGFRRFLLATLLAGMLQVAFGVARLGGINYLVPTSVIRGMLAAIGLILILKQIPHAVGFDADYEGDFGFRQMDGDDTFTAIPHALGALHPGAILVALAGVIALLLWRDYDRLPLRRNVPRELVAVVAGGVCAFLLEGTAYALSPEHRVTIPVFGAAVGLRELWTTPDFSGLTDFAVWKSAGTISLVASIESLLSVEATDRLDPERRHTPPNRELVAQGLGNMTSGFLGGLPVTAVVVRSFANVQAGARTRWSSVVHGVLLLVATVSFASVLNHVPLAALAVVLLAVGYKLTAPKLYRETWLLGKDQFLPFVVTVLAILLTDLLNGVIVGVAVAFGITIVAQYRAGVVVTDDGPNRLIRFTSDVSFLHKARIKQAVQGLPHGSHVIIDGTRARLVHHDVLETLRELELHGHHGVTLSVHRSPSAAHGYFRTGESA